MKKAIIFDMDGTLWDSVDNIVISWNQAMAQIGQPDNVVTRARIIGIMGKTMDKFAEELFPSETPEEGMELFHVLEEVENEYLRGHGAVLLGDVKGTFEALRQAGFAIGIVSNCQAGYIEAFLDHYGFWELVDDLECFGNTKQGKAENLRAIIERNGWERFWYVGDTNGDAAACQEAAVPFIWAAYGFDTVEADIRLEKLEDLPHLMQTL